VGDPLKPSKKVEEKACGLGWLGVGYIHDED
jgi:hypothetical protein